MPSRSEPAASVEAELVEHTDRHGRPYLAGTVGDARVRVFLMRLRRDAETGTTRRIWRMVVKPLQPSEKPPAIR